MMKTIILAALFVYILAMGYLYFTQEGQIFNTQAASRVALSTKNLDDIHLKMPDGTVLQGIKKDGNPQKTLIYFGGNADDARSITNHLDIDHTIIAFNYRGYIDSTGKPSEKALFADALKIYDAFGSDKETILMGRSLGTAVAAYLASQRKIHGLILITPFDSIASMAKKKYPFFPIDILLKHPFRSDLYMKQVRVPVGLVEVLGDRVTPKYHFDRLKSVVQNVALHVQLSDTTHGNVLSHPDFQKSMQKIVEEISKYAK